MRTAFIAVFVLVPLQYLLVERVGEPYPAISMPAFGGTLTEEPGRFHATSIEVVARFADGGVAVVSPHELLAEAPRSHRIAIMRNNFAPMPSGGRAREDEPRWETWLKSRVFPILIRRNRMWYEGHVPEQTVAWLRARFRELFAGRPVVSMRVDWYDDTYVLDEGLTRSRELRGSREIALADAP